MRKMFWLVLLAAALAAPCLSQEGNATSPDFSLTISAPAHIKVGSEVDLTIKITNTSTHDIDAGSFYADGVDMAYRYELRDSVGNLVRNKHREMIGSIRAKTLKPGDSAEEKVLISRIADMTRPGQYKLRVSRTVGGPTDGVVKSNEIALTVTP
ncbi:MAG TPA: hypothetical protein VLY23_10565 [Candidatus Acidoferrum sp.]|nr:hypothetical protein [Candidatus Acidoferrum sp.]